MKDFAGKIAFITGGASGVGLGQAKRLSERGCRIVIADFSQEHIDEAMAYFKAQNVPVHPIRLDVTDRSAFAAAADETERVFGEAPDILVLTAGVNVFGPAEASTYDDYDWVMDVCLGGVVNGLVTFVPRMIKKGRGGHIAATVSWGAFGAGPITAPYATAKSAVLNLMESYMLALKPYGIGVCAVCPANVRTNIYQAALTGRPEKYGHSGYNVTEKTQQAVAQFNATGMDPLELADKLIEAMEDGRFLVVPYEHDARMVELAFERFPLYCSPEGMEKLEEKRRQPPTDEERMLSYERENGGAFTADMLASGFGKAAKGIGWVEDSKKL
ncbi:MAG: SDR family oxidoreductase [Oscillospiraceae bacterium]|nr:SDR family oxidoreductase [Oscillospiraceae bacterium]